ncbi:18284_t:CDS:2 [Dentiscutata erythropus]|uniref:18284_t:CDS:1 n=1 Tax=Dentiscutata erythropus TaxID=1348616 RepID=A0A9N9IF65_9GLOM|nr:18284_t:CDS:2 [Dentiscutata erythropus]
MASIFCAVSFVKNVSNANKYTSGTDPAITENGQGIFRLKQDIYNGVTVAGELIPLMKSSFILCEAVEWNYPTSYNIQQNSINNQQTNNTNKRQRLEDLECIAEKFNTHSPSTHKKPTQPTQHNIIGHGNPSTLTSQEYLNNELPNDKNKSTSFENNSNIDDCFPSTSNNPYP